jgi:hypothetical protein
MSTIQEIAYTDIIGLPLTSWLGILTIVLLFLAATIGYALMTGKLRTSINTHKAIAGIAIIIGLIHGAISISIYL